ncbi:MAG: ribbon-helix-helix domain-containing protein [Egibacteraceae bacterium]
MKTAISVPDPIFQRVEHHARRLGLSRSEFFARAAQRWADELDGPNLTAAINDAVEFAGPDETAAFVRRAAERLWADPLPTEVSDTGRR